jgi:hypothetical protein
MAFVSTDGSCHFGSHGLEDEYKGEFNVDGGACVDCSDGGKVECIVQWWRVEMEGGRAL